MESRPLRRKPSAKPSIKKVGKILRSLQITPKPRPATRNVNRRPRNQRAISRRPTNRIPPGVRCSFTGLERVTQITVPTTVTPGTLLYQLPANPLSAPRLQSTASQFDSWYGNITLEVETTGNSFNTDYVVLRHVPNGDPGRLPTNALNLLNLAETSDRNGESAKLQLDANRIARVSARWSESYNPRKPIIDTDPSECNNGLFIIVADGSPGTTSVNLTVRLRYNISFYGPIVNPQIANSSQLFTGVAPLSGTNFLGASPTSIGFGSATASGNVVNLPIGQYIITSYATGTGLVAPTATFVGATVSTPTFTNVASGTVSMGTWNVNVTAANATFTIAQTATTVTASYIQINPLKFT